MLLTIVVTLGVLWLLGLVVIHVASPLFHLLIVIAIVVLIYDFLVKRRSI